MDQDRSDLWGYEVKIPQPLLLGRLHYSKRKQKTYRKGCHWMQYGIALSKLRLLRWERLVLGEHWERLSRGVMCDLLVASWGGAHLMVKGQRPWCCGQEVPHGQRQGCVEGTRVTQASEWKGTGQGLAQEPGSSNREGVHLKGAVHKEMAMNGSEAEGRQ